MQSLQQANKLDKLNIDKQLIQSLCDEVWGEDFVY
jgi:hypothetical protein